MVPGIRGSSSVSAFISPAGSTNMTAVAIEVFLSNFCENCANARLLVEKEIAQFDKTRFDVYYIDVVEQIDHAVALGVLATPAIAIDGKLVFTGLPTSAALQTALTEYAAADE